jgi:SAM-dependent methyltransferase
VGGSGHVVATDLEPRFLEVIHAPNLAVWRHDILREPLPEGAFDLVHARALLGFLPKPAETIGKMAAALKPGGWLLLEARLSDPRSFHGSSRYSALKEGTRCHGELLELG